MAGKEYCAEYWLNEHQESMGSPRNITEIMLKVVLNAIQSSVRLLAHYQHFHDPKEKDSFKLLLAKGEHVHITCMFFNCPQTNFPSAIISFSCT